MVPIYGILVKEKEVPYRDTSGAQIGGIRELEHLNIGMLWRLEIYGFSHCYGNGTWHDNDGVCR